MYHIHVLHIPVSFRATSNNEIQIFITQYLIRKSRTPSYTHKLDYLQHDPLVAERHGSDKMHTITQLLFIPITATRTQAAAHRKRTLLFETAEAGKARHATMKLQINACYRGR